MRISSEKPQFDKAIVAANELLVNCESIVGFPVRMNPLSKELFGTSVKSFSKFRDSVDLEAFGSKSAFIAEQKGKFIVFFNDSESKSRQRFSIAHEIGHPVLEHRFEWQSEERYGEYEIETNFFAAQLLMPDQIIKELESRGVTMDTQNIMNIFGVSKEAANRKLDTLRRYHYNWRSSAARALDSQIVYKYREFLDSVAPANSTLFVQPALF